ncbi:hypothetical protein B0I37DRAFT_357233 [Chaetomium sp. MPI-CAGE-AT-0009]|nr:hypothetical protein B0I37DRAFT_357233 [Chaetomium sp. MPI-CAGE-AT-0009]
MIMARLTFIPSQTPWAHTTQDTEDTEETLAICQDTANLASVSSAQQRHPTDPELREHLKQEIQQEPSKSGDGKGQRAAWKGMKLVKKKYEAHGGGYENDLGSKNEPKTGAPMANSEKEKHNKLDRLGSTQWYAQCQAQFRNACHSDTGHTVEHKSQRE